MDMTQLEYFVAVQNTLSFRAAARKLGVSQSSVSRQIGELERQLGVLLLDRTRHSVCLTGEGEAFLPYALDILGTAQSAEFLMQRYRQGITGHLSVTAVTTSSLVMAATLREFTRRHPNVIVDVTMLTGSEQISGMTDNKYDFVFAHRAILPAGDRMDWMMTHREQMVLVTPKGHPLTQKPLDFRDLEQERFIAPMEPGNPLLFGQILDICRAHGYTPSIISRYDSVESVLLAVSAGLGVSIMPAVLPQVFFAQQVDTIPIQDVDTRRTYIVAWPKNTVNPSASLFLDVLYECFGGPDQAEEEKPVQS